ncbi:MAG: HAD family hydrolase [Dehalococcoidia bacterium]|nr:HAD family hydrolase [Dehalococcoidia bacterium]
MDNIRVVSFDLEGTLVTPEFSYCIWHEGLPALYARRYGLSLEKARTEVKRQYDEVGDGCCQWYDIKYWFCRFKLGDHVPLLMSYRDRVVYYPEVRRVLDLLGGKYRLIISSGSSREFIPYLLGQNGSSFSRIFSSISDYGQLKTPEFYRTVCREMEVSPAEVVHVGDSWRYDYLSPTEAGIKAYHLDRSRQTQLVDTVCNLDEFVHGILKP